MSAQNGGPAFPLQWKAATRGPFTDMSGRDISSGMSLRDYFAARFITAQFEDSDPVKLAKKAYEVADAMLHAREVTR